MRKKIILFLLALTLIAVLSNFTLFAEDPQTSNSEDIFETFNEVMSYIFTYHVDENNLDDLIMGAMKGMVNTLDPYSSYMTEDEFEEMQVEYEGHFGGIGIVITPDLTIISPIKGTPAERVGIQSGDKIIAIEGEPTELMTQKEAVDLMRGEPGTEIDITVDREGQEDVIEFNITREDIEVPYVEWEMKNEKIGYINISQFVENVGQKVNKAVKELENQGAEALILDLRSNPGGLLNEAINVSSNFIEKGTVVSVKYKVGKDDVYKIEPDLYSTDLPLLVLINQGSASASEIVAAAVKDYRRGTLMGMKTFGKGTVQSLFPMEDGSALKLTTGRYYSPADDYIHEKGIKPDVEVDYDPEHEGDNQLEAALQYIEDMYFADESKQAS
ncbi:MAG: S41 family peptidase [Halanaerobiaceae bacterium]